MNTRCICFWLVILSFMLKPYAYSQVSKFNKELTRNKVWKLYQIREDEKIDPKVVERVLFSFKPDGKGLREEDYKLGSKKINIKQLYSFEVSQDPANEYVIKFQNTVISRGKAGDMINAPLVNNFSTFFVQLLGKDSSAIMRLTTPSSSVSKSTIHYYFK